MIDATGMPQSAVVVGGTSDIGLAIVDQLAARRLQRVLLASRDEAALEKAADSLTRAGLREATVLRCDITRASDVERLVSTARERLGEVDCVIVAAGDLGTAELEKLDPGRVLDLMASNAGGPAAALIAFARLMAEQGSGQLVVLSSVAGLRVRRANFVYGAGKAALDGLALALGDALEGSGVSIVVVRPGYVFSKMTEGRPAPPGPLNSDPTAVARAVVRGLERGQPVVFVPPVLRVLSVVWRALPRRLFRRLPG